jgi:adenylate kinase family enzyme
MKIRIIGGCGSGKTYIARILSNKLGITHVQTDNLVWNRSDDTKYSEEIRDRMLCEIINQESWIIEGVHHKWGYGSFKEADYIFIIKPRLLVQNWRTFKRFVKTNLRLEERNYTQDFKNLFVMIGWNNDFEQENMGKIMKITSEFITKRYIVKNNKDILKILNI